MKNLTNIYLKTIMLSGLLIVSMASCERDYSEDVAFATFPAIGDVFDDAPIAMGSDFYFPYDGSKPTAWSVDRSESYMGTSSMRVDVPDANDPEGNYAGAIFRIDGDDSGRDLSGFDALTFYAKASQAVTIGEIGFGEDFGENKYVANLTDVQLTTNWVQYIIPLPDPSKLIRERGMLRYAAAGIGAPGQEVGYTFWIDEVKFEKLGTIAQPRPAMLGGEDVDEQAFLGSAIDLSQRGLTQTFHLASGINQTVSAAPSYFNFKSSDVEVARVSELGIVTIIGDGTATITADLDGVDANGSLTLTTVDGFETAPIPTLDPSDVISVYSDSYTNVPVDFLNGYWEPWQTTLSTEFSVGGNSLVHYTEFNFVGNQFGNPPVDATTKPNLHIHVLIDGAIPSNLSLQITVKDFGADGVDGGGDDTTQAVTFTAGDFTEGEWRSLEIPISLANKNNIGQIIYENTNGSSLSSFYIDNIYFHN